MKGFYSRKLHSLLGVIPLGFFILEHMITNFAAVEGGPQGFKDAVAFLNSLPLVLILEIFGIWLPLLYHAVYGLYIAFQAKPNNGRFRNERNLRYLLQRITGVLVLIFVVWHIYETRVQVALGHITHEQLGSVMHDIVTQPVYFTFYLIGVLSASFHFTNGLWSFLVSWGVTVGPRAQRVSSNICMGLFVIISIMFVWSLIVFRNVEFQASGEAMIQILRTVIG
ncbi:succinate dehydrogenase / fumarate reductase cytochrome b subunit [Paenibacillus shirakamiensis]|uniref:Succinate dehydrogenase / fumarate reductase cytochrome b subunit n=1 Tax=Paenibacillus shirakamiensis TaxID=1265935 RepID=A0ABS4JK64_9BACL|nr:succinate dehydrogenase cytochrome b558 subunit [Paenibacillus shirakamiensis]MBP2002102.1 succinate dehydrogenase / fumarate reductase cytochrome b subunit [Paenibacillus shirakamiensis]